MEYRFFDGTEFIKFWVCDVRENTAIVAVTKEGKTSFQEFDVLCDNERGEYFEYGLYQHAIYFEDFEVVK